MKFYNYMIDRIKERNWKYLCLLLIIIAVMALVPFEVYNDLNHLTFSKKDMKWLGVYIFRGLLFVLLLLIIYLVTRYMFRKGGKCRVISIGLLVVFIFIMPLVNGSIFGVFFVDAPYWGRVIDADTGEPIAGARVAGEWEYVWYAFIYGSSSYADARETITDEKGRFFLPIARTLIFWPLSNIELRIVKVYKPGYDTHPTRMQRAWDEEQKEKWRKKLNRRYHDPNPLGFDDHLTNTRYSQSRYSGTFHVNCKRFKTNIIRLNKATSYEERRKVAIGISFPEVSRSDEYKVREMMGLINRERKRYGLGAF